MANISIKSEKLTPFGGIFHVRELFFGHVLKTRVWNNAESPISLTDFGKCRLVNNGVSLKAPVPMVLPPRDIPSFHFGYLTTAFLPSTMYIPLGSCEGRFVSGQTLVPWMVKMPRGEDATSFCNISAEDVVSRMGRIFIPTNLKEHTSPSGKNSKPGYMYSSGVALKSSVYAKNSKPASW